MYIDRIWRISGSNLNYRCMILTDDLLEEKFEVIIKGLYMLFSNPIVYQYNPNIQVKDYRTDVIKHIDIATKGINENTLFEYYIFDIDNDAVIGTIYLISPQKAKITYGISSLIPEIDIPWYVEFYLNPNYWGKGVITSFLKLIIDDLLLQGYKNIMALTHITNVKSIKILQKLNFETDGAVNKYHQYNWLLKNEGSTLKLG